MKNLDNKDHDIEIIKKETMAPLSNDVECCVKWTGTIYGEIVVVCAYSSHKEFDEIHHANAYDDLLMDEFRHMRDNPT